MTTHAFAYKPGRSYLDYDKDATIKGYLKRYFRISMHSHLTKELIAAFDAMVRIIVAVVAPMIFTVIFVDQFFRNKDKVAAFAYSLLLIGAAVFSIWTYTHHGIQV